ncbi:hypothetical protein VP01_941g4 [Puccinia sorghi]|uniref:Uncharacterized protein n=1 Tax=Puccinia sorghi TaxID=27349 RepID=A0A0L6U6M8_9BASI|nr:hypothetical protein VP01_941g4 [Puccinia sorghi]
MQSHILNFDFHTKEISKFTQPLSSHSLISTSNNPSSPSNQILGNLSGSIHHLAGLRQSTLPRLYLNISLLLCFNPIFTLISIFELVLYFLPIEALVLSSFFPLFPHLPVVTFLKPKLANFDSVKVITLQKTLAQLPAVDKKHSPANLPSKLHLFAYNHSWRKFGVTTEASWDFLHVNFRQLSKFFLQYKCEISLPSPLNLSLCTLSNQIPFSTLGWSHDTPMPWGLFFFKKKYTSEMKNQKTVNCEPCHTFLIVKLLTPHTLHHHLQITVVWGAYRHIPDPEPGICMWWHPVEFFGLLNSGLRMRQKRKREETLEESLDWNRVVRKMKAKYKLVKLWKSVEKEKNPDIELESMIMISTQNDKNDKKKKERIQG